MVSFNRATGTYEAIFKSKAIIKAPEIIFEGNVTVAGNLTANGSASLSGGSAAVARVGDEVQVDPKTHKGTIISCSSKATSG
jgi:phage baseplate assembly protein gpV